VTTTAASFVDRTLCFDDSLFRRGVIDQSATEKSKGYTIVWSGGITYLFHDRWSWPVAAQSIDHDWSRFNGSWLLDVNSRHCVERYGQKKVIKMIK